ncbi:hypothetical protein KY310_03770 [Candidatus Woesearchaeota archaeon]|nr:hypothetical protein [Candidatus Woesearchaeota archaeon]
MTERMIGLDEAVAIAEAPVEIPTAPKETNKATVAFCIETDKDWRPVALPAGADVALLKELSGARNVYELQFDVAAFMRNKYREVTEGPLNEHHVYNLFTADRQKLEQFFDKYELHR